MGGAMGRARILVADDEEGIRESLGLILSDEHDKIVRLVQDVAQALKTRNPDHVFGSLVSLEVVMTRHHEKEEDFFLPMASHILLSQREQLLQALGWFE